MILSLFLFNFFKLIIFRKKNHALITCELEHVSLDLHVSFIIRSPHHLELHYPLLGQRLLDRQFFLLQVCLIQVDFLHGHYQECLLYLVHMYRLHNLTCLLLFLLLKEYRAGTPTWLAYNYLNRKNVMFFLSIIHCSNLYLELNMYDIVLL